MSITGNIESPCSTRLRSVDVLRGITIAWMILVNTPGVAHNSYYHLQHAKWNGWSAADLVFPFFLFIVGVVIPFSVTNRLARGESREQLYFGVIRRTIILFALGLFINSFPFFSIAGIRIPGILQRIALCYFFSSFIVINFKIKWQISAATALLILYWALMKLLPVPHYGAGVLTKDGNLAFYIDNLLMHGYMMHRTSDPDGLFSTIPAISTTLFGVMAGHIIISPKSHFTKLRLLTLSGGGGMITGLIMDMWFPINKALWSPSYTVFSAGSALLCLGVCYWLVDVKGYTRWGLPFEIYGTNAIAVYVLSSLVERFEYEWTIIQTDGSRIKLQSYIFQNYFASWANPLNASLFYALTHVLIWLGLSAILYRKKIFIKI